MAGHSESTLRSPPRVTRFRRLVRALGLPLFCAGALASRAALQFDVFLGYDWIVPQASWFPVVCEIKNDGPPFVGTVELDGGRFNQEQTRRAVIELPTGTLKRFVIPVFATAGNLGSWDVRLLDERGKIRAEQTGLRAKRGISSNAPLIGALARTPAGMPVIRPILPQDTVLQPGSARFLPTVFPDNPVVLQGMDCLYLNSEKALDLKVNQVNAIFDWLNGGGHLIVGVEQISDISATPWLRSVLPCSLNDIRPVQAHPELQEWLRSATWPTGFVELPQNQAAAYGQRRYGLPPPASQRRPGTASQIPPPVEQSGSQAQPSVSAAEPFKDLPDDPAFEAAGLQVAMGELKDGQVVVSAGDKPLIVTANRGRGRVTLLLFSPEREPFRSWKNLPTFWAKLAEVPGAWYVSADYRQQGGWSSDGIFGAMIDTRQVHKLPVTWLLLLLVVYLVVIGPLDQRWLKRIGRPMLTWITFPCYVVLFSLLIYFIGYKLRAGESEWNELHLVDVLAQRRAGGATRANLRVGLFPVQSAVPAGGPAGIRDAAQRVCRHLDGLATRREGGLHAGGRRFVQRGDLRPCLDQPAFCERLVAAGAGAAEPHRGSPGRTVAGEGREPDGARPVQRASGHRRLHHEAGRGPGTGGQDLHGLKGQGDILARFRFAARRGLSRRRAGAAEDFRRR